MIKHHTIISALFILGSIIGTARGVTPELTETFCAIASNYCRSCNNLCSKPKYYEFGKKHYSSGCGEFCNEENGTITIINFKGKRLNSLSSDIGKFTDLTILDLSSNNLKTLPDSLRSLKSLTKLYIRSHIYFILFYFAFFYR